MSQQPETPASARTAWLIVGTIGLLVAAAVGWVSYTEYNLGTLDRPGAGVFPVLVAVVLAAASVLTLLQARGASFTAAPLRSDGNLLRLVMAAAVILGGAALLPYVGFLTVVILGGLVLAVLIEREFRWIMPVAMVIMGFAVWAVFELMLGISLPGFEL